MERMWSTYLSEPSDAQSRNHPMDFPTERTSQPTSTGPTMPLTVSHTTPPSADRIRTINGFLGPPLRTLASPTSPGSPSSPDHFPKSTSPLPATSNVSLSANYLPNKFSSGQLATATTVRRRKRAKGGPGIFPKIGGGVDAFRSGQGRIPGEHDEDDDDDAVTQSVWFEKGGQQQQQQQQQPVRHRKLRWNKFKWVLVVANSILTIYSITALIFCLLTWFDAWFQSDIIRVGNHPELTVSTLAASFGIFAALVGWSGILLNNRTFLATYTFLLWITFIFLIIPGYVTYKRRAFNLEGKINAQWSRDLGAEGRLRIQNQLGCCGYFSPYVEATVSGTCYSRSILPGCKAKYLKFERQVLTRWYTTAFALVPVHVAVMVVGLLCSNHVTYRFGKGMMPKAYRLSTDSMAVIIDRYAQQLAEQYGADVASEIITRSKSNLDLQLRQVEDSSTTTTTTMMMALGTNNSSTISTTTAGLIHGQQQQQQQQQQHGHGGTTPIRTASGGSLSLSPSASASGLSSPRGVFPGVGGGRGGVHHHPYGSLGMRSPS